MIIKNDFFKNVSYSFLANIISMIISVMMILLLPKLMDVRNYSIWQLYIFYTSYLGFFHFGWLDGIYLRYGGYEFAKLNKRKFSSQLYAICLFEIVITIILLVYVYYNFVDILQKEVLIFSSLLLMPIILYTFSSFILQITNKIKEYAKLILFERICFVSLIIVYFFLGYRNYLGLFYIDLISKIAAMIFGIYIIKSILVFSLDKITDILNEIFENISVGSKLLFANIASMLILGIIRFGISEQWNIETFGKVSLALSIANFLMVFINAVSVVLFPMLKRIDDNELKNIFIKIDNILTILLLGGLLVYYPLKALLAWWLPQYNESLHYVAILFPLCFFESKVVLLFNTYLKALRKELLLLKINISTVIFSIILTVIFVFYLHNIELTVLSILLLFFYKYLISKLCLLKELQFKKNFAELFLIMFFIIMNLLKMDLLIAFALYSSIYIIYLFINKSALKEIFNK